MRTCLSVVAVTLGVLLAAPAVAPAQTFSASVAGGADVTAPSLRTFTVQASVGRRISKRFEARVDVFGSHSVSWSRCDDCAGYTTESVAGLTGNGIVNITSPRRGPQAYVIGGLGAYCLGGVGAHCLSSHAPFVEGFLVNMRFGLSTGVGGSTPIGPRSRMFLEARFHYLLKRLFEGHYLLPVTLGVRF